MSYDDAVMTVFEYIIDYNANRIHSSIDYLTRMKIPTIGKLKKESRFYVSKTLDTFPRPQKEGL